MRRFSFFVCCAIALPHKERSPKHLQAAQQHRQCKRANKPISETHVRFPHITMMIKIRIGKNLCIAKQGLLRT
jgi:hypothetical protein